MNYPTDLNDKEWESIKVQLPKPSKRGRPREVNFREVLNGEI